MSNVYFISDTHFYHRNIIKYREEFRDVEHHNATIINNWNLTVNKRDLVYVLGDSAFSYEGLMIFKDLNGRKILVRGNHEDRLKTHQLLEVFDEVHGLVKYKGYWLSHAPIHPAELRGKKNIHGHVHRKTIQDSNYINVSCENVFYKPVRFSEIEAFSHIAIEANKVVWKYGQDWAKSPGGACTLQPWYKGYNEESGWFIEGMICDDYIQWINYFEAWHPDYGYLYGDYESMITARSDAAIAHFMKHHEPDNWDYSDI